VGLLNPRGSQPRTGDFLPCTRIDTVDVETQRVGQPETKKRFPSDLQWHQRSGERYP